MEGVDGVDGVDGFEGFEGFDNPLVGDLTNDDGVPLAWLHAHLDECKPRTTTAFVAGGGALDTALFAGHLDLAVSGSSASSVVRLGSELDPVESSETVEAVAAESTAPAMIRKPLGTVAIALTTAVEDADIVPIQSDAMLLASLNVGALTSSATVGETHAGFGYASLARALRERSVLLVLRYGGWEAIQQVVALSNVHLRAGSDPGRAPVLRWRLHSNPSSLHALTDATPRRAAESFVNMVLEVDRARKERLVYTPLPGLSKIFAAMPIVDFTSVEALLHAPSGLDANALEALLRATVSIALQQDADDLSRMVLQAARPPPLGTASPWRSVAARAIHLAIRFATEYRADGGVEVDEHNRLAFRAVESWLPHAARNFFAEANDCDGSAMLALRLARQIGLSPFGDARYRTTDGEFVSLDAAYEDASHPWTRAVRNALSHSDVLLFTIVGASTGEGTNALGDGSSNGKRTIAGHAVPLFVPLASFVDAMGRGPLQNDHLDDVAQSSIDLMRTRVVLSIGKLRAAGGQSEGVELDPPPTASAWDSLRRSHLQGLREARLHPLAIDGTVTSEMDLHTRDDATRRRAAQAHATVRALRSLGPTIADRLVDLTPTGPGGRHAFYHDFVEAVVVGGIGDDPTLVRMGAAAANFAFVATDMLREQRPIPPGHDAGAKPLQIGASAATVHDGDFALLPLAHIDSERAAALKMLREMTRRYAMPPRRRGANLNTPSEVQNAQSAADALFALGEELSKRPPPPRQGTFLELYVTPRAMWGSPNGVQHLINRVTDIAHHGQVDLIDLTESQPNAFAAVVAFEV